MALFFFVLGCVFGSFLNVLVDRLPNERPILNDRSVCDSCHKRLKWFELIPLVSFIIQKGKCRHCSARIPSRIFFVELLTGFIFAAIYYFFAPLYPLPFLLIAMAISACLIVIFFADWQYGIIPDEMLIALGVLSLILMASQGVHEAMIHIITAVGAFVGFYFLYWVTRRRGMGFGDVKFAFIIGLLLGFPGTLISLYFAFLTGGVISLILIIGGKKRFRRDTIAFGPFLVCGIAAFLIFQGIILQYLHTFGL